MRILSQLKAVWLSTAMTLLLCATASQAQAQTVPVTLNVADATLEQVLESIESQTNYLFVYDKNVDVTRKVTLNAERLPLKSVLAQLFKSSNTVYAVESTSIVLSASAEKPVKQGQITGVVKDSNGEPVIGAAVVVKGSTNGVSTGIGGDFVLQIPPPVANAILTINYLGYEPMEVVVGTRTNFDITLAESSVKVDDVIVTALGIKRSEKALSYNVQKVAGDDVTGIKDVNFINALSGKVAGVNINASSSGVGGASKVVMRGTRSIEQSSNALYVIDGMPMFNFQDSGGKAMSSRGSSEAIADINPEDIESITVLTGAAAAALYGSNAANGAIAITTKKGKAGFTSVTVTSNTEISSPFVMPKFQNRYGTSEGDRSWGSRLNDANYVGYDPSQDYLRTGVVGTETISLATGNDRSQTYFSAGAVNSRGIVPNNGYDRYNFTIRNTSTFFKDKMTLDLGASYIKQNDRNMTNQGVYANPIVSAYLFPRGNDWEDIKMYERWDSQRKINTQYFTMDPGEYVLQNPYWLNYRNLRESAKDRYMMNANLSYQILDWLSVSGRIRIDNSHTEYTEKVYASTSTQLTEQSKNGLFEQTRSKDRQTYGDVMLNINKTFGEDWSLQANIGGSFSDMYYDATKIRGPIRDGSVAGETTGIPNVFNLMQLSNVASKREQIGWREQMQSVFVSAEVGYKNTYFLSVTGRNDWPSQLAGPNSKSRSFFYPSIGGSIVLSQIIPNMPKNLHYVKLRGSFASVGLAFTRFIANPTYAWTESSGSWQDKTVYPMYNLKPERTKSWEVGLTMRFFKHFNLDVSYYNTKTINQTFKPDIPIGSGYKDMYIQSGNVRNRGVELALGYSNTWNKFSWSTNYTLSSNSNEILSLAENAVNPITGELFSINSLTMETGIKDINFLLRKGGSLGDLYSSADLVRDSNGHIYVDENGQISSDKGLNSIEDWKSLGSVFPKANMAWRNDFKYGNLSFGFMLSARIGGIVYSRTQATLDYYGVSEASAAARDAGGMWLDGGSQINAQDWYNVTAVENGIPQLYTYSATNVRLQEASIGYTIPKKKLRNIMEITVSLVGRNLWMIYNKAPFDPEATASTGNYYQGIDYFMMPSLRNIGFNVRVKF